MYYIARYKRTRFWGVYRQDGELVCVCVYKKGAQTVIEALTR